MQLSPNTRWAKKPTRGQLIAELLRHHAQNPPDQHEHKIQETKRYLKCEECSVSILKRSKDEI